jgi:hypothetical protein
MTDIQKLIELWNARPTRVEPNNEDHLLYIFTGLLPALRDAMPKIVEMVEQPARATGVPNTDLPPAPAPEPSIHIQAPIQNTAGNGEVFGPTVDNVGKPVSSPAIVAEIANCVATKRPEASKRARPAKARKPVAAPPEQSQKTAETAKA